MPKHRRPIEQRLDLFRAEPTACWVGPWKPEKSGYVRVWLHPYEREAGMLAESEFVHRVAFRLWVGAIPEGFHIDHLCRNRRCFNPAHLESVTPAVNNARSTSASALNALKSYCKRGHALTTGNVTLVRPSRPGRRPMRRCRQCDEMRNRAMTTPGFEALRERYRAQIAEASLDGPRKAVPAHCKHGHSFDEANTYYYIGTALRTDGTKSVQRGCRLCRRRAWQKHEADPKKYARKQQRKNEARRARYAAQRPADVGRHDAPGNRTGAPQGAR